MERDPPNAQENHCWMLIQDMRDKGLTIEFVTESKVEQVEVEVEEVERLGNKREN